MPVEDRPVHESTKQGPEVSYGCHNQPRLIGGESYPFWDREAGQYIGVPVRASLECQYDRGAGDPKCAGCEFTKGQAAASDGSHSGD